MSDTMIMEREEIIQKVLLEHPEGLSIEEVAKLCKVSVVTMRYDLRLLLINKRIHMREIGKVKLHYHLKHAKNVIK